MKLKLAGNPTLKFLALAAAIGLVPQASAQTADSALAFLQTHMCSPPREEGYDSGNYSNNYHIRTQTNRYLGDTETFSFFFNNDMQSHDDNTGRDFSTLSWKLTVSGQLSDLSPDVTLDGVSVKVECTERKCLNWARTHLNDKWYGGGSISSYTVTLCDSQSAARIAKAISVLIQKAGGKPSQF